jgi:rRNA small subunit pseudouridine methyltransferase Nep1
MSSNAVLNLIIAEAALELIPGEISRHASVRNDARRRDLDPSQILLDRSIHHTAMLKLKEDYKRGRPDLVHLTLLSVTSTPLYQRAGAKVYIHTRDDAVLEFKEQTRPPKSYSRFRDLMQQTLYEKPDSGLITFHTESVPRLELAIAANPTVLIGGFPKGHFTPETTKALDTLVRIDADPLDAHVVAARLVYEVEKAVGQRS